MADASDSKSDAGNSVWVQVPSPAYRIKAVDMFPLLFLFSNPFCIKINIYAVPF